MRRYLLLGFALVLAVSPALGAQRTDTSFAGLVARLSEPGGYFDSDNIITNEASYLTVASQLASAGTRGGMYIGVGPDQNFSYIALITDIRRDNLLEHLLFKSYFMLSRNRLEYLCLLFGKPVPVDAEQWSSRPVADLLAYVRATATDSASVRAARKSSNDRITAFGIPLDAKDRAMVDRYREEFVRSGLDTRYSSLGRNNRMNYPSFAELAAATDRAGKPVGYLGDEGAFQFVRAMQVRDRIIPVIANVAGTQAMAAIAAYGVESHLQVSAFYLSNVEQYLIQRNQGFDRYVANVRALPRDAHSVIIRSAFGWLGSRHPLYVPLPSNVSTSMVETFASFLGRVDAGAIRGYDDLVSAGYVKP